MSVIIRSMGEKMIKLNLNQPEVMVPPEPAETEKKPLKARLNSQLEGIVTEVATAAGVNMKKDKLLRLLEGIRKECRKGTISIETLETEIQELTSELNSLAIEIEEENKMTILGGLTPRAYTAKQEALNLIDAIEEIEILLKREQGKAQARSKDKTYPTIEDTQRKATTAIRRARIALGLIIIEKPRPPVVRPKPTQPGVISTIDSSLRSIGSFFRRKKEKNPEFKIEAGILETGGLKPEERQELEELRRRYKEFGVEKKNNKV